MYRVLMVDDDPSILEVNRKYFNSKGYDGCCAANARDAFAITRTAQLDCIVLDVDLPDLDGFELCDRIREISDLPIIFLSAYTQQQSRVRGLSVGGDDYICKPYDLEELELRCRIRIQRRLGVEDKQVMQFPGLTIDIGRRIAFCGDQQARLTSLEFDILAFLAKHPGQVFSYEQIYDRVWRAPINSSLHSLHVYMSKIRQNISILCPEYEYIRTVRGKGYAFTPPKEEP